MTRIPGAYPCSYCHGNIDNACTACDPECDCLELQNHRDNECEIDCQFCDADLLAAAKKLKKKQQQAAIKTNKNYSSEKRSAAAKKAWKLRKKNCA
jgi:hypothetical protein